MTRGKIAEGGERGGKGGSLKERKGRKGRKDVKVNFQTAHVAKYETIGYDTLTHNVHLKYLQ